LSTAQLVQLTVMFRTIDTINRFNVSHKNLLRPRIQLFSYTRLLDLQSGHFSGFFRHETLHVTVWFFWHTIWSAVSMTRDKHAAATATPTDGGNSSDGEHGRSRHNKNKLCG